jgi:amino acid transporter
MGAFVFLPSLKAMISLLVAAFVLCYTAAPASLLKLRKTHSDLVRPFKIRFTYLLCFLSLFFSNLMVFSCGWIALRNLIGVTCVLLVGYFFVFRRSGRPIQNQVQGVAWFLFEMIAIVLLCYLDHSKTFPYHFLVLGVAIVSGIALILSQREFNFNLSFSERM